MEPHGQLEDLEAAQVVALLCFGAWPSACSFC